MCLLRDFSSRMAKLLKRWVSAGQYFDCQERSPNARWSESDTMLGKISSISAQSSSGRDASKGLSLNINSATPSNASQESPIHRLPLVSIMLVNPIASIGTTAIWVRSKLGSKALRTRKKGDELFYDDKCEEDDWLSLGKRSHHHSSKHAKHGGGGSGNQSNHHSKSYFHQRSTSSSSSNDQKFDDYDLTWYQTHLKMTHKLNKMLDKIHKHMPKAQLILATLSMMTVSYLLLRFYSMSNKYSYNSAVLVGSMKGIFGSLPGGSYFQDNNIIQSSGYGMNSFWTTSSGMHDPIQNHQMLPFSRQTDGMEAINGDFMAKKFEILRHHAQSYEPEGDKGFLYSIWAIFGITTIWGTMGSLILYGRILPPIPDLANMKVSITNNRGSGRSSRPNRSANASNNHHEQQIPWAETYKSIASENHIYLHLKVTLLRVFENVMVCAILPRTAYVCKLADHCYNNLTLMEVTGLQGITGRKAKCMFDSIVKDHFTQAIILAVVVIVSYLTLIAQMITLDRNHVALEGFAEIEGDAKHCSNDGGGANYNDTRRRTNASYIKDVSGNSNATSSSSRRTGGHDGARKGGRHNKSSSTFSNHHHHHSSQTSNKAFSNENISDHECSGGNLFFKITYLRKMLEKYRFKLNNLIANELGHSSTSPILAEFSNFYCISAIALVMICLIYAMLGWNYYALVLTFIALFNSAGTLEIDLIDFSELETISREIFPQ
eukprot:CAMPEP_0184862368 /NCGR_PEP_ID=MMETSP0580-20130426/6840_1 /TAXON_ID=1118495 /ORGANISM="Dactyliosolen fragilissimus" /LENGTH=717 /DNA_ID=CAMNT_0027360209 /DNA_START=392 /DNA_END=2545 /DNA_ORIENTATION=-